MFKKTTPLKQYKKAGFLFLIASVLFLVAIACKAKVGSNSDYVSMPDAKMKDSIASVTAFKDVYSVLMHPRCMNCHPKGDIPLQGDESRIHTMLPQRGKDGLGVATMKCATCHADKGVPGENTPPGNPSWHLPPADMKMIFEGRSARELALQLVDLKQNGNKDMQALREHAEDTLVKAGWNMGGNRSEPPLTYEEFKKAWYTWLDTGAYAPAN